MAPCSWMLTTMVRLWIPFSCARACAQRGCERLFGTSCSPRATPAAVLFVPAAAEAKTERRLAKIKCELKLSSHLLNPCSFTVGRAGFECPAGMQPCLGWRQLVLVLHHRCDTWFRVRFAGAGVFGAVDFTLLTPRSCTAIVASTHPCNLFVLHRQQLLVLSQEAPALASIVHQALLQAVCLSFTTCADLG